MEFKIFNIEIMHIAIDLYTLLIHIVVPTIKEKNID